MLYLFEPDSPITTLHGALPPLVQQLDHSALAVVEAAMAKVSPAASELASKLEHPDAHLEVQHRLWRQLMRVFEDENRRLFEGRQRVRRFSDQYFAQVPGRARTEILINQLRAEADSFWQRFWDVRAVDRHLDVETYLERHTRRESHVIARVRLTLLAAEYLAWDIAGRAHEEDLPKIASALLSDIGANVLLDVAASAEFEDLAWHALRAAKPLLVPLLESASAPALWLSTLVRISGQANQWSWHRRTAFEILAHEPESGYELLLDRLTKPSDAHDDWHVRARCGSLLVDAHGGETTWKGLRRMAGGESSDGVLFEICTALGNRDEKAAVELLFDLGQPPFVPKVRACAARSLAWVAARGEEGAGAAAEFLARLIDLEQDDTALRIMTHRMAWVLSQPDLPTEQANVAKETLRDALAPRLEAEKDAALANALTDFRQEMAQGTVDELVVGFKKLEYGQGIFVAGDVSESDLGLAMAIVARDGYGLYARRLLGRWRVRRGERFRTRPWRVLHELRHPAPNKRQGYHHTRARVFPGALRAHPTHLGELTPTAVPGERKQVGAEGGWAPYLPHVDDVLDAQISRRPIRIFTSVGVTELEAPRTGVGRLRNYAKVSWRYADLDGMRQASILGGDEQERGRFLAFIENELGTKVTFRPFFEDDPVPPHVRSLIGSTSSAKPLGALQGRPKLLESATFLPLVATSFADRVGQFMTTSERVASQVSSVLFERVGVRIQDLGFVIVGLFLFFVGRMVWARHRIDVARNGIPLSVGGWGTRGKSGTERLKAGMFHGMGYDVFVKTTGCEAMFIHAPRGAEAREIFIYRPYDKASIWEQRDMLEMGYNMRSDVFLWECMALNPRYVEILQAGWMRDDIVTLTNAYPDHEDIQGPAGVDVAATIGRFLPRKLTAITAEREMLPVFQELSRKKQTNLLVVGEEDEFLIPDDSLQRFPYNEHPRNISLCARLAQELGIEPEFATFMMADKVVPDLGVLKVYPEVNVRGRYLKFINGCSANERAGFMNNWTRMNLNDVGPKNDPTRRVATVVNNRGDRVSRSVVFADILVRDVAVDRHILIGTNLSGLRIYFNESLDRYLANVAILDDGDNDADQAHRRLRDFMSRVRIFRSTASELTDELRIMLSAVATEWSPDEAFENALESKLKDWAGVFSEYDKIRHTLSQDDLVLSALKSMQETALVKDDAGVADSLANCPPEDAIEHWCERLACAIAHDFVTTKLNDFLEKPGSVAEFHKVVHGVWRQRFWHTVHSIDDPEISGDGIILEAAKVMPPGCHIDLMGTQNIKGTGLDFVYRWVELNTTMLRVNRLPTIDEQGFADELMWLSSAAQFGMTEALQAWRALGELSETRRLTPRDVGLIERARAHLATLTEAKLTEATARSDAGDQAAVWWMPAMEALEKWLDPLDAVARRYRSEAFMRDLAAARISHAKMAYEMQKLTKRQKGGWLTNKFR